MLYTWIGLQVVTPAPGGPADKAGLKSGDVIVSIDGKLTNGLSLYDAGDLLQGSEGSQVCCQCSPANVALLLLRACRNMQWI